MINHLISLTISRDFKRRIETQVPSFCFEFLKKEIAGCLALSFIPHEQEENSLNDSLLLDDFPTKKNFWGYIEQPKSSTVDRSASFFNPLKEEIIQLKEEKSPSSKKRKTFARFGSQKHSLSTVDENILKKKTRNHMVDLPCYDIVEPEDKRAEEEEKKRQELMSEEKEKEREILKKKAKEERRKKKIESISAAKFKGYLGKNITLDANGKIVKVQEVNPNIFSPEFKVLTSNSKEVKVIEQEVVPITPPDKIYVEKVSYVEPPKVVVSNNTKEFQKKFKKNKKKIEKYIPFFDEISKNNKKKENEKIFFEPSGSNFDIIVPEVGVTVHEDEKYKTGGMDFYRRYKKFSPDYFKKLIAQNKVSSSLTGKKDSAVPVENPPDSKKQNDKVLIDHEKKPGNVISKRSNFSIKMILDNLDLTNEDAQTPLNFNSSQRRTFMNFFRRQPRMVKNFSSSSLGVASLNEINKFNSTILSSQEWGANTAKNVRPVFKSNDNSVSKERKKDIKNPSGGLRERKKNKFLPFLNNDKLRNKKQLLRTASTGFFKFSNASTPKKEIAKMRKTASEKFIQLSNEVLSE